MSPAFKLDHDRSVRLLELFGWRVYASFSGTSYLAVHATGVQVSAASPEALVERIAGAR